MSMLKNQTKSSFVVEGNIGAGKSTFLRLVKKYLDVNIIYEPCSKWQRVVGNENLLEQFYRDTPRWAYTFQNYAFVTRVLEFEKEMKEHNHPIHVLERSVFSDRYCFAKNCYEMGCMSALEWQMYQDWFSWLVEGYLTLPTGFIYLRVNPQVSFHRLQKRNRSEESTVSLYYLQKLHDKHDEWLVNKEGIAPYLKAIPVLVLNCNDDFETDVHELEKHMNNVVSFMQDNAMHPQSLAVLSGWKGCTKTTLR